MYKLVSIRINATYNCANHQPYSKASHLSHIFLNSSPYPSESGRTPHRSGGGASTASGKYILQ